MKRSVNLFLFLLTAWFVTMCDSQSCGCAQSFDLDIEVAIEDAAGNDLLDPTVEGHLEEHDIMLFHEIRGQLKRYEWIYEGEGIAFQTAGDYNRIHIKSNSTSGNKVLTVLRVKDHADIQIITKVNGKDGARVEKIWYKDQLVWPVAGNDDHNKSITVTLE